MRPRSRSAGAAREQLEKFTHACFAVTPYEGYVELAERLNRLVPGAFAKKTLFANSGVEAVENAVKIARRATGREAVLVFEHAFHGRTLLGMSMNRGRDRHRQGGRRADDPLAVAARQATAHGVRLRRGARRT